MIRRKIIILNFIVLWVLCGVKYGSAQDEKLSWAIKPSYSILWYKGELNNQFLSFSNRSDGAGLSAIKYISPSFDIQLGLDYFGLNISGEIDNELYYSNGNLFVPSFIFNYKFNNGYILAQNANLKPYLGLGFNYLIGRVEGVNYNFHGDKVPFFVDEIGLNTNLGVKYEITKRIGVFFEIHNILATTEELDGASIDMKNDRLGGMRAGFVIKVSRDKDQDKDGVIDDEDECPDTPFGVKVDEKGCPLDGDKDGIPDYLDECPDIPGLPEYNGCPDTDGDGIIDKEDDCPELPGLPEYNGCPDTDGDGVIDPNDICPDTQPGIVVDEYGCPIDSDGDGLTDDVDQCPDVYGPMEYMGCPEPPDVGWPETNKETPPEVYFETNKSELSPEGEEEMMKLVRFMADNPNMNIRLFGSADPRGSKEYNKKLSTLRVLTVKKFLMRKGIPENRIIVKALGETQDVIISKEEENFTEDQRLRKYRKVMFQTFFFMR